DEAVVVTRGGDPACLVQDDGSTGQVAVELAPVADMREQEEHVPGVRRRHDSRKRAPGARGEPDLAQEASEVPRGRVLADGERGLLLRANRDRNGTLRTTLALVAAVHDRVRQAQRADRLVDAVRPAEPVLELV